MRFEIGILIAQVMVLVWAMAWSIPSHALADGAGTNPLATGDMVRFKLTVIPDPMINNSPAGSILVPDGWTIKAAINWTADPYNRVSLHAYILGPDGVGLATYPSLNFHVPFGGFREQGPNYLGWVICHRISPLEYIKQAVIPQYRQELQNATIVSTDPSPDFASQMVAKYGQGVAVDSVKMHLEYQLDGKPVEEDMYCAITVPRDTPDFWTADARSFRAAKGRLQKNMGIGLG